MINKICICSFIFPLICFTQTLNGKGTDKITQEPIITAAVYFDNTTIGTTTDAYDNYTPIKGLYFSGYMGNQRRGDTFPLDYSLKDSK